jgi:predicted 3-demethylubiquinone-9 3-methyltransferase (glyoxalase superfamily)
MPSRITPFLWFDNQLEEAVNFYVSVFPNSRIHTISRQGEGGPAFTASFELDGQPVMGLNGGPLFSFTEAFSFFVSCETQAEVDRYWTTLTADGGQESQCGWLKDRFGLSWQIVPTALMRYLADPDPVKSQRVMAAMLQMQKIDIASLDRAYQG